MATLFKAQMTAVLFACLIVASCGETSVDSPAPTVISRQSACHPGTEDFHDRTTDSQAAIMEISSAQSECLSEVDGGPGPEDGFWGTVRFATAFDTLYVYHDSAVYQCCAKMAHSFEQAGDTIDIIQYDTSLVQCDCYCAMNLSTTVTALEFGTYHVRLWTTGKTNIIAAANVQVAGGEGIAIGSRGDTVYVDHQNKLANCGTKYFYEFQQQANTLTFFQVDTSSTWLRCICRIAVSGEVGGVDSGIYDVFLIDRGNTHGFGGDVYDTVASTTVAVGEVPEE